MRHSFTVELNEELSTVLKKVEAYITGNGGRFEGDTESGFFDGKSVLGHIKGEYRSLAERQITITIIHRPFLVPYSKIESAIRKYFS
ncbi:MAG TPA: hypothetical protein VFG09_12675 [Thermodesulfovibrionales bacterium]|jgi:hypothetical protein|nr:hypothetical protein [Thermodesulfovibrionales bacterium]